MEFFVGGSGRAIFCKKEPSGIFPISFASLKKPGAFYDTGPLNPT
jgi:hypothetical protein